MAAPKASGSAAAQHRPRAGLGGRERRRPLRLEQPPREPSAAPCRAAPGPGSRAAGPRRSGPRPPANAPPCRAGAAPPPRGSASCRQPPLPRDHEQRQDPRHVHQHRRERRQQRSARARAAPRCTAPRGTRGSRTASCASSARAPASGMRAQPREARARHRVGGTSQTRPITSPHSPTSVHVSLCSVARNRARPAASPSVVVDGGQRRSAAPSPARPRRGSGGTGSACARR